MFCRHERPELIDVYPTNRFVDAALILRTSCYHHWDEETPLNMRKVQCLTEHPAKRQLISGVALERLEGKTVGLQSCYDCVLRGPECRGTQTRKPPFDTPQKRGSVISRGAAPHSRYCLVLFAKQLPRIDHPKWITSPYATRFFDPSG